MLPGQRPGQLSAPEQRRTRPATLSTAATNPRHAAPFPRLFGAMSGNATGDAVGIGIRSPGRRCNSSHLLEIDHLLPVAQGGGPEPENLKLWPALLITDCATATDRLRRRGRGGPRPLPP